MMKKYSILKTSIPWLILFVGAFGCYKFMTSDRADTWAKEFPEYISAGLTATRFTLSKEEAIDVASIKLPPERALKIQIQKALSTIGIMSYGCERGTEMCFVSSNPKEMLKCKAWCLDDHLIGVEIAYKNIDPVTLQMLKHKLEVQFYNYKIVWTEM